jgi:hypothetical protein
LLSELVTSQGRAVRFIFLFGRRCVCCGLPCSASVYSTLEDQSARRKSSSLSQAGRLCFRSELEATTQSSFQWSSFAEPSVRMSEISAMGRHPLGRERKNPELFVWILELLLLLSHQVWTAMMAIQHNSVFPTPPRAAMSK